MKTNRFLYMTMVCAALGLSACTSDTILDNNDQPIPVDNEGQEVVFTSAITDGLEVLPTEDLDGNVSEGSRAAIDELDFTLTWKTTDKISITDKTLTYTFSPSEESKSCNFESRTGATFITDGSGSEGTFYAFYPADAIEKWNGETVTTMIYTEQLYSENVENSGVMGPYMAAKATTTEGGSKASFKFGHICSVVDVDLSSFDGGTIQSVSLLSNSGASLAGRMSYKYSDKTASLVNNDASGSGYAASNCISNLVTVSNVGVDQPSYVRFYVLPVQQASGFTITVRTTDGNFYTKKSTTSVGNSAVNTDYLASMSNQTGNACLPYYKKYKFNKVNNATQNLWMATIPNNLRLRQLTIPGAHDAATKNCGSASKCQTEDIAGLLANGVRGFDLRPAYTSFSNITADNLMIYHSSSSTGVYFKDAISTLVNFVKTNPSEFVTIIMQKENSKSGSDRSSQWRAAIRSIFGSDDNVNNILRYVETYQNVGDARGKLVIVSKNPTGTDANADGSQVNWDYVYGGKIDNWPDASASESCVIRKEGSTAVADASVEDSYDLGDTNAKKTIVSEYLNKAMNDGSPRWFYIFNSLGYKVLGDNPSGYASTMNPWLTTYINNTASANRLGFIFADFIGSSSNGGAALLKAIIQHNHKYVYKGRTRNVASGDGTDTGVDVSSDEYADDGTVYSKKH